MTPTREEVTALSAHRSDPRLLVLHAIRVKGLAPLDKVAAYSSLDEAACTANLQALATEGLAAEAKGRISGWTLTPDGRAADAAMVAAELDEVGVRDGVHDAYRRFLEINHGMLGLCTDWQLRDGMVNDHTDTAYDSQVIDRLHEIDTQVQPIVSALSGLLVRFDGYRGRLTGALTKLDAGDRDWFTRPFVDSYHTVWFELHEDLLSSLGIERSKESGAI